MRNFINSIDDIAGFQINDPSLGFMVLITRYEYSMSNLSK